MIRRHDDVYYPVTDTRAEGMLAVGGGVEIHWEEAGNPQGVPLVECHGGPGGRANRFLRALLDPDRLRIVQFDQRACGKSTGELADISLAATIADMEALRAHLGIERWIVSGPSWGSTVALAYAEAHPERTIAVKVAGVWLCRHEDMHWWYQGVRTLFPDVWAQYASLVPPDRRHDLRSAYCEMILDGDPATVERASLAQYLYEEAFMHLQAPFAAPNGARAVAYSRVFAHHARHDFFLRDNQLIEDAHRLRGIPVSLTTGRYDACTTPNNAYDLAQVLDDVHLTIVDAAGHYPSEPAMGRAMAHETRRFLDHLQQRGLVP